jgi:hypothetical protein
VIEVRCRRPGQAGAAVPDVTIAVAEPQISVRDLIRRAVAAQVAELSVGDREAGLARTAHALARQYLTDAEVAAMARSGKVSLTAGDPAPCPDPSVAAERAVAAFSRGVFVVFAGGRQLASLDDTVRAAAAERVVFLRLTPLAGG